MTERFWIWFAIKWWGFCRFFCKQAAFGFVERQMPEKAERWWANYEYYNQLYGLALACDLSRTMREALHDREADTLE